MDKEEAKNRLNFLLNESKNPYGLIDQIYDDFDKKIKHIIEDMDKNIDYIQEKDPHNVNAMQGLVYTKEKLLKLITKDKE